MRENTYERVFRGPGVPDEALCSLRDTYAGASEIVSEALDVFRDTAELELGHGLFLRSVIHG